MTTNHTNAQEKKEVLKDYATDKPILETDRLLLRALTESDVPDLKEWLGKEEAKS